MLLSTKKRLPARAFKDREEYLRWSLSDVDAAFGRWRSLTSGPRINRRQFFEVFTDYTGTGAFYVPVDGLPVCGTVHGKSRAGVANAVISQGAFLGLPVAHFHMFDTDNTGAVYVYEVLLVLLMFCQGDKRGKTELAFKLFDFNSQGHLGEVRTPCVADCYEGMTVTTCVCGCV